MYTIASILPKGEGFCASSFGAIALCMRDFTLHSQYKNETVILGGASTEGFAGVNYAYMKPAKWYQNRTRHYASQCADYIRANAIGLAEIHNRPHFLKLLAKKVKCRLALHLHNDPQTMQAARTVQERELLLSLCDAIYCVSGYIKNRFMEGMELKHADKVHVIYNGLEVPPVPLKKEKILLYVGRMTEGTSSPL